MSVETRHMRIYTTTDPEKARSSIISVLPNFGERLLNFVDVQDVDSSNNEGADS